VPREVALNDKPATGRPIAKALEEGHKQQMGHFYLIFEGPEYSEMEVERTNRTRLN
jgi:hypothetical protein